MLTTHTTSPHEKTGVARTSVLFCRVLLQLQYNLGSSVSCVAIGATGSELAPSPGAWKAHGPAGGNHLP